MKCLICNKEHKNKKYCSEKCQHEAYRVKKVERIKIICLYCGEEFEDLENKKRKYCSRKCKDLHQKELYKEHGNPLYGKIMTEETKIKHSIRAKKMWTDKNVVEKIKNGKKKYNNEHENKAGWDENSIKKRKNTNLKKFGFEHNWSNELIRKRCYETCIDRYGKNPVELMHECLLKTGKTNIEKTFEKFLIENNIKFKYQYKIYFINVEGKKKYKFYDFLLIGYKHLIEIDGDYWHGNPNFFKVLNEHQIKNIKNDILKNEIAKANGYNILRIWECEIYDESYKEKILNIVNNEKNKIN